MTRSIWKGPFVEGHLWFRLKLRDNKIKKVWSKRSVILPEWVGLNLLVYNGHSFFPLIITEKMIGFKIGEFIKTRKSVVHRKL